MEFQHGGDMHDGEGCVVPLAKIGQIKTPLSSEMGNYEVNNDWNKSHKEKVEDGCSIVVHSRALSCCGSAMTGRCGLVSFVGLRAGSMNMMPLSCSSWCIGGWPKTTTARTKTKENRNFPTYI